MLTIKLHKNNNIGELTGSKLNSVIFCTRTAVPFNFMQPALNFVNHLIELENLIIAVSLSITTQDRLIDFDFLSGCALVAVNKLLAVTKKLQEPSMFQCQTHFRAACREKVVFHFFERQESSASCPTGLSRVGRPEPK